MAASADRRRRDYHDDGWLLRDGSDVVALKRIQAHSFEVMGDLLSALALGKLVPIKPKDNLCENSARS